MQDIKFLKQEIKNNVTIEEVIEHYLGFSGRNHRWKCPFNHDEEHLNFAINGKRTWRCFSCQESGDEIKFVMKLFDMDMPTAMMKIAVDFGINISASPEEIKKSKKEQALLRKKRELEKKREENLRAYETIAINKIKDKIKHCELVISKSKPFNISKLDNYGNTESCCRYIQAVKHLERLNAFYDIVCENDLRDNYFYIYPALSIEDKKLRKITFLRKLYKGEITL